MPDTVTKRQLAEFTEAVKAEVATVKAAIAELKSILDITKGQNLPKIASDQEIRIRALESKINMLWGALALLGTMGGAGIYAALQAAGK